MSAVDVQARQAADFRYVLHVRRQDVDRPSEYAGELLATDGLFVRSIRSRGAFVTVCECENGALARAIVDRIQREWRPSIPLLGYSSLANSSVVAILRPGASTARNWVAFPCSGDISPLLALRESPDETVASASTHVVGGAELRWRHGEPNVETALELRSRGGPFPRLQGSLFDYVEAVELHATAAPDDEESEIGLVPRQYRRQVPVRTSDCRLEAEFPLSKVVFRQFHSHPSFRAWLRLQFDEDSLGVPSIWRRFSLSVRLRE